MKTFRWEARYWIVTGSMAVVCLVLLIPQFILCIPWLVVHPWSEVRRNPPLAGLVRFLGRTYDTWLVLHMRNRP